MRSLTCPKCGRTYAYNETESWMDHAAQYCSECAPEPPNPAAKDARIALALRVLALVEQPVPPLFEVLIALGYGPDVAKAVEAYRREILRRAKEGE